MSETSLTRRLGVALPVEADAPDLRDTFYSPSLRPLPPALFPEADLRKILVRTQGREGSCTGQALAAVIDLLRAREAQPPFPVAKASARMLVELARTIDQQGSPPPGGAPEPTSLRPTLKAFYHHGVCLDEHWAYGDSDYAQGGLTKDRLDHARALTLGAYYRLQPVVNHVHAALNEAGAVYVAAVVHPGWAETEVRANGGRIPFDPASVGSASEGHAFAVVGYDQAGFLVLNSWGEGWGGYAGVPGLAHWSYEDWAFNVLDGWVVRLAVPTPGAFAYTIGRQGKFAGFEVGLGAASGSMPRRQVLGHYLHLDDGAHVLGGPYPSSQDSLDGTIELLVAQARSRKYTDVLLWLAGANEGTEDVVTDIARLKPVWLGRGVYPITVLWCTDFVGSIVSVLDGVFASAQAQVGEPGPALDRLIETRVRGPGRAFLRDIKRSSRSAVTGPPAPGGAGDGTGGPFARAFVSLGRLRAAGYRIHVAAEGVGAILLADLVARTDGKAASTLASVTLLAPTLTEAAFRALAQALPTERPAAWTLATASAAVEERMRCGPYRGSILRLVDRAFEDDGPDRLVGLAPVAVRATAALPKALRPRLASLEPDHGVERPLLRHLTRGSTAVDLVLRTIRPREASARHCPNLPLTLHDRAL